MAFRIRWQTNAENHQKIADRDLRTGTLQKFSDLRLQNEPTIFGLTNKICVPTYKMRPNLDQNKNPVCHPK
jgi:hypothetical protein